MGSSRTGCVNAMAWLLRQPEDAITVQELVDLYRSARGYLALPRCAAVAAGMLVTGGW